MINLGKKYRNIYILDSRAYWNNLALNYDVSTDLVLTFDFGLRREIKELGGDVFYVDSLCSPEEMQKNNLYALEFLKLWHYDKTGRDIFIAQGVSFGFAFRIDIWSEYIHYVRLRANLEQIREVLYEMIFVGEQKDFVSGILNEMDMQFTSLDRQSSVNSPKYYFDIHKYMYDALHKKTIKDLAKDAVVATFSSFRFHVDRLLKSHQRRKIIYAQIYHPTKKIIDHLLKDSNLIVVTSAISADRGLKKFFVHRSIPIQGRKDSFHIQAEILLNNFRSKRNASLILSDGTDVTVGAYKIIDHQIQTRVSEALRILSSVISYVKEQPIDLELMIANIGFLQTIVDCVLKSKSVPSYLIINGLMPAKFGDEAKYALHINSYGLEAKINYFNHAKNVVCLGDPRMDEYINRDQIATRTVNRSEPTIGIGSSGFNNLDFNSYVAVEFDFMFDVLTAFQELKKEGQSFRLIIKVRPNGVLKQYKSFVSEYFSDLNIEVLRNLPMSEVLQQIDLYISIYSQTLFEASCLGIPVIYYKNDREYLDPPFDGKSELVTVNTVNALKEAFHEFKAGNVRFDPFLKKSVMEKYIGPLDGKNLQRNLDFVYKLLAETSSGVKR